MSHGIDLVGLPVPNSLPHLCVNGATGILAGLFRLGGSMGGGGYGAGKLVGVGVGVPYFGSLDLECVFTSLVDTVHRIVGQVYARSKAAVSNGTHVHAS